MYVSSERHAPPTEWAEPAGDGDAVPQFDACEGCWYIFYGSEQEAKEATERLRAAVPDAVGTSNPWRGSYGENYVMMYE